MIISKTVLCKGKEVRVEDLKPNSNIKVTVQCQECEEIRAVLYASIVRAGHTICQKCMMKKRKGTIPVGTRYGSLVVLGIGTKSGESACRCDCGKIKDIYNYALQIGKTKSCGCLRKHNFDGISPKAEQHGNWKGGIASERGRFSQTKEYKDWRLAIFKRDGNTCLKCLKADNKLNTHHIVPFEKDKALRIQMDNGVTLCEGCHREFHKKYGRINTSRQDINEFLQRDTDAAN